MMTEESLQSQGVGREGGGGVFERGVWKRVLSRRRKGQAWNIRAVYGACLGSIPLTVLNTLYMSLLVMPLLLHVGVTWVHI